MKKSLPVFLILIAISMLQAPAGAAGRQREYRDTFPGGKAQMHWMFFPFFNKDNLKAVKDEADTDGDGGVGVLTNDNMGGFASLSYLVAKPVQNFELSAMLYCPVTEGKKGPLAGLAFFIDPMEGDFYRVVCDFKKDEPTISLAFVGRSTLDYPVYIKFWGADEMPGGAPQKAGWHRIEITLDDYKAKIYWDGQLLDGGPFQTDNIRKGYVGVYANFVGGLGKAKAMVDEFVLKPEGEGISASKGIVPLTLHSEKQTGTLCHSRKLSASGIFPAVSHKFEINDQGRFRTSRNDKESF